MGKEFDYSFKDDIDIMKMNFDMNHIENFFDEK